LTAQARALSCSAFVDRRVGGGVDRDRRLGGEHGLDRGTIRDVGAGAVVALGDQAVGPGLGDQLATDLTAGTEDRDDTHGATFFSGFSRPSRSPA